MQANEPALRRVLLALDAAGPSPAAISFAVTLAARFEAELDTLLLTQTELARAVALPFASEISLLAGLERRLDTALMQRSLQSLAERVRTTMTQIATPVRVRWSLELAGWPDWERLLAQPISGSLFVLSHPPGHTGSRESMRQRDSSVCVVHHEEPTGLAALEIATALDPGAIRLLVTRSQPDPDATRDPGMQRLLTCLQRQRPGTVVLPADWYAARAATLRPVFARMDCNLLLVA